MKVMVTALSISSTHMKMMIMLRLVRTPTTQMVKRTTEKSSYSASIGLPSSGESDCADDRRQQQDARDFERQQVFVEERAGDRLNGADGGDLSRRVARRQLECLRRSGPRHGEDHGEHGRPGDASGHLPSQAARVGELARMAEVEQHDHEQK